MEGKLLIDALFDLQDYWEKKHNTRQLPFRYISPKSYNRLVKAKESGTINVTDIEERDKFFRVFAENENGDEIHFNIPKGFLENAVKWSDFYEQNALHEHLNTLNVSIRFFENKLKEDAERLEEMKKERESYERKCEECDRRVKELYGE